ncbi:hypothetical protein [Streptomyces sp. KR80]|uniref:hypothetical protein n=1 Tax=Streptomyces sp. KR80 TaxID=3457426 RepID=UPI003FD29F3B
MSMIRRSHAAPTAAPGLSACSSPAPVALFALAALPEVGAAWLDLQGVHVDVIGAPVCLAGVTVIMYAPRGSS